MSILLRSHPDCENCPDFMATQTTEIFEFLLSPTEYYHTIQCEHYGPAGCTRCADHGRPKIIAFDFDGCLVENAFPEIGPPIHATINALKKEQASGAKIILWTCRHDGPLLEAVKWCIEHGIYPDAINENLDFMNEIYGETRKVGADEYWDDKAVRKP